MNNADRPIDRIDRSEKRQNDGVVSSEGNHSGMINAIKRDRNQRLSSERVITQRRESWTLKQRLVTMLNLLDGVVIIIRGDRDISTIDDLQS